MRTLVIPDIHQDITPVLNVLETETYHEVVFLGDYFDCKGDDRAGFTETCLFLQELCFSHPNRHLFRFLVGNHDLSYLSTPKSQDYSRIKEPLYPCSGWTRSKASKFQKSFPDPLALPLRLAYLSQGFLFTHAGLHHKLLPKNVSRETLVEDILPEVWRHFRHTDHPHNHILRAVGDCRGGPDPLGGILWCDWNYEFDPSPRTGKQVFGHTLVPEPQVQKENTPSESWNLNTGRHYGLIVLGNLTPIAF